MKRLTVGETVRVALMAAVICVLSLLTLPIGVVPMTLQTFAVALAGAVLGPGLGVLAVVVYWLVGLVGIPVFSGMQAGIGVFFGPTGGYLMAFAAVAAMCGLLRDRSLAWRMPIALASLPLLYLVGTFQLSLVTGMSFERALQAGVFPFVVKDVFSVAAAVLVSRSALKALKALPAVK